MNNKKRNRIFLAAIISSGVYLFWRIFFTLPWQEGVVSVAAGCALVLAETVTLSGTAELMISRMRAPAFKIPFPEKTEPESFPHVDVLIATHNEPEELLYKTVNACTFLEYPDPAKVHVYVCDDGGRENVRKMAEHLGAGYIGMKENPHAKSGNYNHALERTSSPLVATFDADMIPRRTFLMRTVPYFLIPEWKLGLLQTPQSFYNQDLFQFNLYAEKGIPNEQDFFSREINLLRNATNTAAYTGSNTVILREALEEIGGFPYGTVTEDFETSLRLQKAGYRTYASAEVLAAGLSTTTAGSMIRQRIRWARGVIQSIQNTNAIFTGKLPLPARISYLNAWLYWWSFLCRLIFLLSPVLFALFDIQLVECGFWELMLFWLPSHLLSRLAIEYLSTNIRSARWSHIIDTILAPYLAGPVLLESIQIRQRREGRRKEKQVALAVPINLRPHFPSPTLRNFILTVRPAIDPELGDYTFPEIVAQVHHHMRLHINRVEMQATIAGNVALQNNLLLQLVPSPIKNLALDVSYRLIGNRPYSTTLTNPGVFKVPAAMEEHIERMEMILGQSYTARSNCACISYGDTLTITFAGIVKDTDMEREFFRHLVREGIHVKVISNRKE